MEYFHKLEDLNLNLRSCIRRHCADETVIYKTLENQPLYIGLFFPEDYNRNKRYPLFVLIHGGGWTSKKVFADQTHWQGDYLGFLARYYADRGFVAASIDYRLAGNRGQAHGRGIIDCYEDCCDALDYLEQHSEEYGIDFRALYLLGESAGGHLAGAVATFRYDRHYEFRRVFLINPITDMLDKKWVEYVPYESTHWAMRNLSHEERAVFLSPLHQVNAHTAPVVLVHGQDDTVVDPAHATLFCEKMYRFRHNCDLHILENTHHAFLLAEYTKEQQACKTAITIIDSYLL